MRPVAVLLALLASGASMSATPVIRTFAGTGTKGFSGDGGPATSAQLADPAGIARGPDGALYICDTANHRIRKVTPDGKIFTVAGTGEKGGSGDGGPATKAQLNEPHSIGFDPVGDLYIADVKNNRVRKVAMQTGVITTLVGNGTRDTTVNGAKLGPDTPVAGPRALDFDSQGNLWLALREGNAVLGLDLATSVVHRIAGTGVKGRTGDGGPALGAMFNGPKGIAAARDGKIYIADTENHLIRVLLPEKDMILSCAGTAQPGDGPEGNPLRCALNRPHGIFVDANGDIFIGDTEAQRVLVIRQEN